jgi:UDP-N-acetyl-L-fucosamine synthase
MYKILTIFGTRPEIIRLSCIIQKLDKSFNHKCVNTGQNFNVNLNDIFFKDLNLRVPDYDLKIKSLSSSEFLSKLFIKIDKILEKEKPDAVLILGDTNSALSAICAKKRKIPIFHIEAGNRCRDERVPEEVNRKIVDHISDINMTYSSYASENLILEGIPKDRIIKIGSPLNEVYNFYHSKIEASKILEKLNLLSNGYVLASIHREENLESKKNLNTIFDSLHALEKKLNLPVIFSAHPRTQKKIKKYGIKISKKIFLKEPFGYIDYVKMMKNAKLVISDSGSITEETSILSLPAINLRSSNERQEGMEAGIVIMTGLEKSSILNSVRIVLEKRKEKSTSQKIYPDYSSLNASDTVAVILQSYIGYIKNKNYPEF